MCSSTWRPPSGYWYGGLPPDALAVRVTVSPTTMETGPVSIVTARRGRATVRFREVAMVSARLSTTVRVTE